MIRIVGRVQDGRARRLSAYGPSAARATRESMRRMSLCSFHTMTTSSWVALVVAVCAYIIHIQMPVASHSARIRLVVSGRSSCGTCPAEISSKRVASSRRARSRKYEPTGPELGARLSRSPQTARMGKASPG